MSPAQRVAYSVWVVLKLLLVMPATTSEHSFSALRIIEQFNIHSDKSNIADEFVGQREGRLRVFGKFNMYFV